MLPRLRHYPHHTKCSPPSQTISGERARRSSPKRPFPGHKRSRTGSLWEISQRTFKTARKNQRNSLKETILAQNRGCTPWCLGMGHHPSRDLGTDPRSLETRTKCTNRISASRWLETETSSSVNKPDRFTDCSILSPVQRIWFRIFTIMSLW